jgi:RimJ/RimL family protein N-acetyltransferase
MTLTPSLHEIMTAFGQRHDGIAPDSLRISAPDCWNLRLQCDVAQLPGFTIRNLTTGDVPAMQSLGTNLSETAKYFFCPYPWKDAAALPGAFQKAIDQSVNRVDASYLMELTGGNVIGHFFLWKAGGNPHSQKHGVQVPELGVAVGDAWQGKGLGALAVRILLAVAHDLRADAVELTTAMDNGSGWNTYLRCGFEYTGIIRNPLDVDVTAVANGEAQATRFRDERQMIYPINPAKKDAVLAYLAAKRTEANG